MFRRTVCSLTQSAAAAARTQTRQALRLPTNTINKRLLVRQMSDVAAEKNVPTKITKIVDQIATLNLLETASLVAALKTRLNIQDVIMAAPQGASTGASGASGAASVAAPVEEKVVEQTSFKVTLQKFDPASKAKVIKEIKSILPGANLVEAKKFVESAPKMIKDNVPKDEAEKIKASLEAVGGTIVLE